MFFVVEHNNEYDFEDISAMPIMTILLWTLAGLFTVTGLAGLVVPVLPGPVLLFLGLVAGAWAEGFTHVGGLTIVILAVLMTIAIMLDFVASGLGVKYFGASNRASWGAVFGGLVGLFWGLPGVLIGPFAGAFIAELSIHDHAGRASKAGFGAWLGFLAGTAAKVAIGFAMVGIFIMARIF